MCHCGKCNGCRLYKDSLRRIAAENRANLLRRKIPPNQMYADRVVVNAVPPWPGPVAPARRVPNLFQRNPNLRQRFKSPPRVPSKLLEKIQDPEEEYFHRQYLIAEAERQRSLAKMGTPKKSLPNLSKSPAKKKKRRDPLYSSVNYDKKKPWS